MNQERAKKFQIMGLMPHEILYGGFLLVYFLSSASQKMTRPFEVLYFALVIAFLPLLCLRAKEQWHQLDNKTLFFSLLIVWLIFFQFLGNSTFGYIDTPSLFHWMWNAYNMKHPAADDGHGNLIPFVVLALFWWKRKELLSQPLCSWSPALLLVVAALAFHMVGYLVQQPRLSIIALFVGIYGLMGMAWGPQFLMASFFPFFLLAFMMPLGSLTEPVTFPLRLLVSKMVAFICNDILGISVIASGTQLFNGMGTYQYEVAAACSGIRSLVAIAVLAIIYAFVVFQSGWQRALLIASAAPLALIGNTFRMLIIVFAAEFGGGQEAGSAAHDHWFWSLLPYVPAIVGLLLIGRWLEKRTPENPSLAVTPRHEPTTV
jgi:exosortase